MKTTFTMVQHHGWSLEALEEMVPYERRIYVDMLIEHLQRLEAERGNG